MMPVPRTFLDFLKSAAAGTAAQRATFDRTRGAPHIRDAMSTDRAMNCVIVALIPCILMALFNTGHQANIAMAELGLASAPGWRGFLLEELGIG